MKLTIMRGLPGSGKTTKARQMVVDNGNSARINRDDLRAMLFDGKWSGKREGVVIAAEKAISKVLLDEGFNPIIDDTNLLPKHEHMWREFCRNQAPSDVLSFKIEDVDTSREDCISNDFLYRSNTRAYVGQPVINRMAAQSGRFNWGTRPIAIFDIDGTLADGSHREHLVNGLGKKDWTSYFKLCGDDEPIDFVVKMLHALHETHMIVVVSGRPDTYYAETLRWFVQHGIPYHAIFMRSGSDKRPDTEVKRDILNLLPKNKIQVVFDDRPSVIRMWRENGIHVVPVRGACEEF